MKQTSTTIKTKTNVYTPGNHKIQNTRKRHPALANKSPKTLQNKNYGYQKHKPKNQQKRQRDNPRKLLLKNKITETPTRSTASTNNQQHAPKKTNPEPNKH